MALPVVMADMSVTPASNTPAGTEAPTNADDYLRSIQAILRTTNAKGSDIASASTTDIGAATAEFVDVTGTTTITALGTIGAGIVRTVRFTGALTLTYNATSLILPGAANITTASGDTAIFRSLGSGNWICINYTKASGTPVIFPLPDTTPIVKGSGDATKLVRVEADGLTTATTRVITMPDFDVNLGINGNTEDTTPDLNADFTVTYDTSAGVLKKVLLGRLGSFLGTLTTCGTSATLDITGIPAWVKHITLHLLDFSTNGTSVPVIQLGDSGGPETSGYTGNTSRSVTGGSVAATAWPSNGASIYTSADWTAAAVIDIRIDIDLIDPSTNNWSLAMTAARSDVVATAQSFGKKATSAALDRLRVTTTGGVNNIDAGNYILSYRG